MTSRRIAVLLLLVTAAFAEHKAPVRVLFIGNSYTGVNNLPLLLSKLAAGGPAPVQIEFERVVVGGATLERHWQQGKALAAIQKGTWDYVVLQEHSLLGPPEGYGAPSRVAPPDRFHEFARLFNSEIRKTRARTLFYMTWSREAFPEMQLRLTEAYRSAARELSAGLVPVGPAFLNARVADPSLKLYTRDQSHPSPEGTYLAACAFYAVITGQSPVGLPTAVVDDQSKPAAPKELVRLTDSAAAALQAIAWRTVREDPSIDPEWRIQR